MPKRLTPVQNLQKQLTTICVDTGTAVSGCFYLTHNGTNLPVSQGMGQAREMGEISTNIVIFLLQGEFRGTKALLTLHILILMQYFELKHRTIYMLSKTATTVTCDGVLGR